jgi:hypothetical protein
MQLWDPKPDSPAECRGSARPIETAAPGIRVGHWLPLTARQARHIALLRTVTLNAEDDNHELGHHKCLCGIDFKPADSGSAASRKDWPNLGAGIAALAPGRTGLPPAVQFQRILDPYPFPGQTAGWLGSRYDPWIVEDPGAAGFRVPDLMPLPGFAVARLGRRQQLLAAVDGSRRQLAEDPVLQQMNDVQQRAFSVLTSAATRDAFDLEREPASLRDRYGRHSYGQSLLLARRLVEAGVRFVQANMGDWYHNWDAHKGEDEYLRRMMPSFDQAFSALIEDLHQRGALAETLVVCMGEMGRNPRLGAPTAGGTPGISDGRNHWQWCWTAVFAGGGVRGGQVIGESDELAGHPNGAAFYPSAIGATVYHALGLDPRSELRDREGRPAPLNQGEPIAALF